MKRWVVLLIIIAAPIITYCNSLNGELHFDDHQQILENPVIRTLKSILVDTPNHLGIRFVSAFTLYINYKLDGYNVFYYHLFNLGFHIINCILIYFVVLLLLRKVGVDKSYLAFLASLFFALHPINSEPLNYIVHGRYMTLCTMFYLLGLMLFILAFDPGRRKWLYFAGCGICYILSIFSKEVGITLPGVLFFYYILFVAKDRKDVQRASLLLSGGVALAIFAILIGAFTTKAVPIMLSNSPFFNPIPKILAKLNIAVVYLGLYILPLPSRLNVDHYGPVTYFGAGLVINLRAIISIIVIAGLISLAILNIRRNRLLSFSLFWIFITHLPTTFVNKGELITEYSNYLPFFGFTFLSILCLSKIFSYSKFQGIYTIAVTLVISTLFAFADIERNNVWRRDLTLWEDCLTKNPNNPRAYNNIGIIQKDLGNYKEAIKDYNMAIMLNPYDELTYSNRGAAKEMSGDHKGAMEDYDKALALNPNYAKAYVNRGYAKNRVGDYKGAINDFDKAIESNPELAEAYLDRGAARYKLGDYKSAMEDFDIAIGLASIAEAYFYRGTIIGMSGLPDATKSAIPDYDRALQLNPDLAEAHFNRGVARYKLGDYKGAMADYDEAIKLKPDAVIYASRSGAKFGFGDYSGAKEDCDKALQKDPNLAIAYFSRGVAKDVLGDHKGAVEDWEHAIQLDPSFKKKLQTYINQAGK